MNTVTGPRDRWWCDNCGRELDVDRVRWRRRSLCTDCAETSLKQDIAHSSKMLGIVAKRRKEKRSRDRRERDRNRKREDRIRERVAELAKHSGDTNGQEAKL